MSRPGEIRFSRGAELLKKWQGKRQQQEVAAELRLNETAYSRYLSGDRKPPAETMLLIERASGGAVPVASWFKNPRRRVA